MGDVVEAKEDDKNVMTTSTMMTATKPALSCGQRGDGKKQNFSVLDALRLIQASGKAQAVYKEFEEAPCDSSESDESIRTYHGDFSDELFTGPMAKQFAPSFARLISPDDILLGENGYEKVEGCGLKL